MKRQRLNRKVSGAQTNPRVHWRSGSSGPHILSSPAFTTANRWRSRSKSLKRVITHHRNLKNRPSSHANMPPVRDNAWSPKTVLALKEPPRRSPRYTHHENNSPLTLWFRANHAALARFVVVHVSGETPPSAEAVGDNNADSACLGGGPEYEEPSPPGRENHEQSGGGDDEVGGPAGGGGRGRWEPGFLEAELRETCLRQLEIPVLTSSRTRKAILCGSLQCRAGNRGNFCGAPPICSPYSGPIRESFGLGYSSQACAIAQLT